MPSRDASVAAIFDHFDALSDPRLERNKLHLLHEMVVIALCAAICGADGWADVERFGNTKLDWFRRFLKLENGIPSHDTFGRVFAMLDTAEFLECLQAWVGHFQSALREQGIAIDGKTMRRSFDHATGKAALHVVSAWATDLRICLGQVTVDDKSNEIAAVPRLLELLELTGAVVTLDAMHCQKETAAAIRRQQADYVLTVKANQPTLFDQLHEEFLRYGEQDYKAPGLRRHTTTEKSHGREERREYYVAPATEAMKAVWPDLQTIGMCPGTPSVTTLGDRNCYELGGAVNTCETMDAEGRPLLRSRGRRRFARLPGLSGLPGCLPGYLVILSRSCRR